MLGILCSTRVIGAFEQRIIEEKDDEVMVRYESDPHGRFLEWSLGGMQGWWGVYEYTSRLPSQHLSYNYQNSRYWTMGLGISVLSLRHTTLGSSTPKSVPTLDYLRVFQRTARLIPIYHPFYSTLGFRFAYLYPAQSILRPWNKDQGAPSQITFGPEVGWVLFYLPQRNLSLRYQIWRGLRRGALWGHEWTFVMSVNL